MLARAFRSCLRCASRSVLRICQLTLIVFDPGHIFFMEYFRQSFCRQGCQTSCLCGMLVSSSRVLLFYILFYICLSACTHVFCSWCWFLRLSHSGKKGVDIGLGSEYIGIGSVAFQISIYRQLFRLFTLIYLRCCLCGFRIALPLPPSSAHICPSNPLILVLRRFGFAAFFGISFFLCCLCGNCIEMDLFVLAKYFRQKPDARKNSLAIFFCSDFRRDWFLHTIYPSHRYNSHCLY